MPMLFDQESLTAAIDELTLFRNQVRLKINLNKSTLYRLGPIKNSTVILNSKGIPWTNNMIKVLGINISEDSELENNNIKPLFNKMQGVCNAWRARDLSLIGKVLVINSLIMSLIVYPLAVMPMLTQGSIKKIKQRAWRSGVVQHKI